jgi:hypothetical protein
MYDLRMEDKGKCSNPPCEESAKSKCSACSTVAYCGIDCQKAHWALHKKVDDVKIFYEWILLPST